MALAAVSGQLGTIDLHKENHTHKNVQDNEETVRIAQGNIVSELN